MAQKIAHRDWILPLIEALAISTIVLSLFYYWYGVADRYFVFLYGHIADNMPQPAQPFDEITSNRYWMTGFVASGIVLVLYSLAHWGRGRLAVSRQIPVHTTPWWQIWILTLLPLGIGIPLITMTVNQPTLPLSLALLTLLTTMIGLAIALPAGRWAAEQPTALMWLALDSLGVTPALLLIRTIELPGRGLSVTYTTVGIVIVGGMLMGLIWLLGMTWLRKRFRIPLPSALSLFTAAAGWSYLILPLLHYGFGTDGYRYITTASNFFAFNPGIQVVALLAAALMAWGITWWRVYRKPALPSV